MSIDGPSKLVADGPAEFPLLNQDNCHQSLQYVIKDFCGYGLRKNNPADLESM